MEILQDAFERKIDYIRISVTDRCNFRCNYCQPEGGFVPMNHSDLLTYEEIEHLCRLFAKLGIRNIKLTGGEPLVRKGVVSLVKKLHHIDGIRQVTMTTNGSLLAEHLADLKAAGLDGVNISLDTLNPKRFEQVTSVDALANVIDAIHCVVDVGIPSVKINCVPMPDMTEKEIWELAAFAKEKAIQVRFIEMMPIGSGKDHAGVREQEIRTIIEEQYGELKPIDTVLGNGPACYYQPKGFAGHIGFISAMSHKFCDKCNRIRLTSDGILKPCLQYAGALDLKKLLRDGTTDEEMIRIIKQAIQKKPECHQFQAYEETCKTKGTIDDEYEPCSGEKLEERMMSGIGG